MVGPLISQFYHLRKTFATSGESLFKRRSSSYPTTAQHRDAAKHLSLYACLLYYQYCHLGRNQSEPGLYYLYSGTCFVFRMPNSSL